MRRALWVFVGLVLVFLLTPAVVVVPLSLAESQFVEFPPRGFTTHWYADFFGDPEWRAAVGRSLIVSSSSTAIAVTAGTLAAYGVVRGRVRWQRLEALFALPMIVPTIIVAAAVYSVMLVLGLPESLLLLVLIHATISLPYVVVTVGAALRTTDPRLEMAAQSLGASRMTAFRRVTLPTIRPAVAAAAVLAMVLSMDEVVIAQMIAGDTYPTLPVRMYTSIQYDLDPVVAVGATVMLAVTLLLGLVLIFLQRTMTRRGTTDA